MSDDNSTENKTADKDTTNLPTVDVTGKRDRSPKKKENVLNSYRSYTYNFTLAVVTKDDLTNPAGYNGGDLDLVIARSGGKGTNAIPTASSESIAAAKKNLADQFTDDIQPSPEAITRSRSALSKIEKTPGFNKFSPGRFDFFIDNVEIETAMAFTSKASVTQPSNLTFEVFEPYSINGFLEALHVASLSADFPTYTHAGFCMKMEFVGYPDNVDLPEPEVILDATRYFMFIFNDIQIELTEKGTRYRCSARPYGQSAYGNANAIKQPVSLQGKTVKEALENFFKNINEQIIASDKSGKDGSASGDRDIYEIKFLDIVKGKESGSENAMSKSKIATALKDNQLYAFPDPATSTKPNAMQTGNAPVSSTPGDYVLKDTQIQFPEGRLINEAIAAVIRDSSFTRDLLKDIESKVDKQGMIDYFTIRTESIPLKKIDTVSKRPYMKWVYKIVPFKIHYSYIPGYSSVPFKVETIDPLIWRRYDYIYTGKNIDILNFKLNFNLLWTDATVRANANNDTPGAIRGAAPESTNDIKSKGVNIETLKSDQNAGGSRVVNADAGSLSQQTDGTAGQPSDDPYWSLARNMHDRLVKSDGASLLIGELEILGDPFYLVTGGIGNYTPPEAAPGITVNGEAAYNNGMVLIGLEFRNPQDLGTFEQGGLLQFQDSIRAPFGGIYNVSTVKNNFREGQFKQVLTIQRLQGQLPPSSKIAPEKIGDATVTEPNKVDKLVADSTKATAGIVVPSFAKKPPIQPPTLAPLADISASDLASLLSLNSAVSNFTNPIGSLLNKVSSSVTTKFGN